MRPIEIKQSEGIEVCPVCNQKHYIYSNRVITACLDCIKNRIGDKGPLIDAIMRLRMMDLHSRMKNVNDVIDKRIRSSNVDLNEGHCPLGSKTANFFGFTEDLFEGWLWKEGDRITISYIKSHKKNQGNFSRLVDGILNKGYIVQVPIPAGNMTEILKHLGFIETVVYNNEYKENINVWVKKYRFPFANIIPDFIKRECTCKQCKGMMICHCRSAFLAQEPCDDRYDSELDSREVYHDLKKSNLNYDLKNDPCLACPPERRICTECTNTNDYC